MADFRDWMKTHDMFGRPISPRREQEWEGPRPGINKNDPIDVAGDAAIQFLNPLNKFGVGRALNAANKARNAAPKTEPVEPQFKPFEIPPGNPRGPRSELPPGYLSGKPNPLNFKLAEGEGSMPIPQMGSSGVPRVPPSPRSNIPEQVGRTGAIAALNTPQVPNRQSPYDNWPDRDRPMPSGPRTPTTTGRVSAPAQTQPQNPNMYYYDPGDGGPMRTLGRSLPNGMSVGSQQGGGYISAVPIPMPTTGAQKFFQADYSGENNVQKPQQNVPMPPRRPAGLGQPTPQPQTRTEAPANKDYGDRMPSLAVQQQQQQPGIEVPRDNDGNIIPMGNATGGAIHQAQKVAKEKATPCHSGIINMAVGGRTDHIPMNVLEGSYVLPADIVSGLGEGNTLAGSKILDNMFHSSPYGAKTPSFKATPKFPSPAPMVNPSSGLQPKAQAMGGRSSRSKSKPVPIIAAGGEYVVHPGTVTELGKGDMNAGHDYLDNFVKYVRAHTAKTLQNLPGPRKD
jgi:hypothetical protein